MSMVSPRPDLPGFEQPERTKDGCLSDVTVDPGLKRVKGRVTFELIATTGFLPPSGNKMGTGMKSSKSLLITLTIVSTSLSTPAFSHQGNVRKSDCTHRVDGQESLRHSHPGRNGCQGAYSQSRPAAPQSTSRQPAAPARDVGTTASRVRSDSAPSSTNTERRKQISRSRGDKGLYYFTRWPHRVEERERQGFEN